jgi:hypothetical protein
MDVIFPTLCMSSRGGEPGIPATPKDQIMKRETRLTVYQPFDLNGSGITVAAFQPSGLRRGEHIGALEINRSGVLVRVGRRKANMSWGKLFRTIFANNRDRRAAALKAWKTMRSPEWQRQHNKAA